MPLDDVYDPGDALKDMSVLFDPGDGTRYSR